MSFRTDLARVFRDELPDTWSVIDDPTPPENSNKPVLMLHREKVTKTAEQHNRLEHVVKLKVLSPLTLGTVAVDDADECLDTVLRILERVADLDWSEAEFAIYENFIGYEVSLAALTSNIYLERTTP